MSAFTEREIAYLTERRPERLGRIATVGKDGTPHVVPVGWRFNADVDRVVLAAWHRGAGSRRGDRRRPAAHTD